MATTNKRVRFCGDCTAPITKMDMDANDSDMVAETGIYICIKCMKKAEGFVTEFLTRNLPTYKVGQNLSKEEVATLTKGKNKPGWYEAPNGDQVYICDGCHRDGHFGFKVLQLGGLS